MTWAAKLPKTILDIRGERLRFLMANAINECEAQYRRGKNDKAVNLAAFLTAALSAVNTMTGAVGSVSVGAISTNDNITTDEAGSPVPVTITVANFTAGATISANFDGVTNLTAGTVSGTTATITISSAQATALSIGTHTLNVSGADTAGITRFASRNFTRTAS